MSAFLSKEIVSEWILVYGREPADVQEILDTRKHWYEYPPYLFSRAVDAGEIHYCGKEGIKAPAYTKDFCTLSEATLKEFGFWTD